MNQKIKNGKQAIKLTVKNQIKNLRQVQKLLYLQKNQVLFQFNWFIYYLIGLFILLN